VLSKTRTSAGEERKARLRGQWFVDLDTWSSGWMELAHAEGGFNPSDIRKRLCSASGRPGMSHRAPR
jgi:hypothetical protein